MRYTFFLVSKVVSVTVPVKCSMHTDTASVSGSRVCVGIRLWRAFPSLGSLSLSFSQSYAHVADDTQQNRVLLGSLTRSCPFITAFLTLSLIGPTSRTALQRVFISFSSSFITLIGCLSHSISSVPPRVNLKTLESGKCTFAHSFTTTHLTVPLFHPHF